MAAVAPRAQAVRGLRVLRLLSGSTDRGSPGRTVARALVAAHVPEQFCVDPEPENRRARVQLALARAGCADPARRARAPAACASRSLAAGAADTVVPRQRS